MTLFNTCQDHGLKLLNVIIVGLAIVLSIYVAIQALVRKQRVSNTITVTFIAVLCLDAAFLGLLSHFLVHPVIGNVNVVFLIVFGIMLLFNQIWPTPDTHEVNETGQYTKYI